MTRRTKIIISLVVTAVLTFLLSAISLNRYNQGQLFYYDFGIFAHIIFQLSRFQIPVINHLALGQIVFLGDHFNPGLSIFAPLFWLTSDLRILLIQQASAVALTTVLFFFTSKKLRLNTFASWAVSLSYLIFAGTLNPLVTDWHPEPTMALLLLLFFYLFNFTNKTWTYTLVFILFLSLKESNAISFIFLALFLLIKLPEKRKQTIIFSVISLIYFFLATKLLIPMFSHRSYIYSPEIPYNPVSLIQNFFNSDQKISLIKASFQSFGFLPFFSGYSLLLPLSELAIRLVPDKTIFNNISLGQHYNVILAVFMGISTIYGFNNIQNFISKYAINYSKYSFILLSFILLSFSLYTARKITSSPINVLSNPVFIQQFSGDPIIKEITSKIPDKGSVMAQNNLLSYASNRTDQIYLLNRNYQTTSADIIAFDLRDGQNINNYYGSSKTDIVKLKDIILIDPLYTRIELSQPDVYLFRKN